MAVQPLPAAGVHLLEVAERDVAVRDFPLTHNGYTYHFCSKACRQIFWEDRDTINLKTVIERLLAGEIQPLDVPRHPRAGWA